jgi:hypothetical protein
LYIDKWLLRYWRGKAFVIASHVDRSKSYLDPRQTGCSEQQYIRKNPGNPVRDNERFVSEVICDQKYDDRQHQTRVSSHGVYLLVNLCMIAVTVKRG